VDHSARLKRVIVVRCDYHVGLNDIRKLLLEPVWLSHWPRDVARVRAIRRQS
jgi:hypothetical protein